MPEPNKKERPITYDLDSEHKLAIGLSRYYVDYKSVENYLVDCVERGILDPDLAYDILKYSARYYLKMGMDEFQKAVREPGNYAAPFTSSYHKRLFEHVPEHGPTGMTVGDGLGKICFDRIEDYIPNIFKDIKPNTAWIDSLRKEVERIIREHNEEQEKWREVVDGA